MTVNDWFRRVPWTIVVCALTLMLLGLAGISRGDELAGRGSFVMKQTIWISLSIPAMIVATLIPYKSWRRWSYPLFALSLLLLIVVFFFPARNGSRRWIPLGIIYFQPSELAKLAFIMTLSHYLMYRRNYRRLTGLLVPFVLTLIPLGMILREPDLGTSLLFLPVLFAMLFAAGARLRHLVCIGLLGIAVLPILWIGMSAEQKSRVVTLFTQADGGPAPQGDGYHLHQSKQLLALGGTWGSDFAGDSLDDPRAYHLPASRTDFVYCLVGERFGIWGTVLTLLLYLVLIGRGLFIAAATREPYGRLLAIGVVTLFAAQTVINTGMTVGVMPITGMTLPLMSYGGSSLLATAVSLGLLMNVAMRPGYEMTADPFRFQKQNV